MYILAYWDAEASISFSCSAAGLYVRRSGEKYGKQKFGAAVAAAMREVRR
jgi:hypothetical protein